MKRVVSFLLLAAALTTIGAMAFGDDAKPTAAKPAAAAKPAKAKYLVIAPHTAEQCLATLDEINSQNAKALSAWDFGCKSGDHTAYMTVTAASDEEVKAMLPASMKDSAKIVKLSKFTPAELKMAHEQH
jgi:hypothetical protein